MNFNSAIKSADRNQIKRIKTFDHLATPSRQTSKCKLTDKCLDSSLEQGSLMNSENSPNSTNIGSPCVKLTVKPLDLSSFLKKASDTPIKQTDPLNVFMDLTQDSPKAVPVTQDALIVTDNDQNAAIQSSGVTKIDLKNVKEINEKYGVMLKNNKIIFPPEKKLNLDQLPETIQSLVQFYKYIEEQLEEVKEFPDQFKGLIALLVEENEVTLATLSKQILKRIMPTQPNGSEHGKSLISENTLSSIISALCVRKDYSVGKFVQRFKWECQDMQYFPQQLINVIQERRLQRQKYLEKITDFCALLDESQKDLLSQKRSRKRVDLLKSDAVMSDALKSESVQKIQLSSEIIIPSDIIQESSQQLETKTPKVKAKKESNAQTKSSVKKAIEEKKLKSQPRISGFFMKAEKKVQEVQKQKVSTFEDYFPNFTIKSNVTLFQRKFIHQSFQLEDIQGLNFAGCLQQFQDSFKIQLSYAKPLGLIPIELLSKLKSKTVKLLQFHDNFRPGFYGTINTNTYLKNRRNPFSKAHDLDYDYDSDEEWAQNDCDEDGEELLSEDDQDDTETVDEDEEDGWLVPNGYLSEDELLDGDDDQKSENSSQVAKTIKQKKGRLVNIVPEIHDLFIMKNPNDIYAPFAELKLVMVNTVVKLPINLDPPPIVQSNVNTGKKKRKAEPNSKQGLDVPGIKDQLMKNIKIESDKKVKLDLQPQN